MPSLAMAAAMTAFCMQVTCGPGVWPWPTGWPAPAQASSHSVISSGSGMIEGVVVKSRPSDCPKPKARENCTMLSAPVATATWPNAVLAESSKARRRLMVPKFRRSMLVTSAPPISSVEGESYSESSVAVPVSSAAASVTALKVEPGV